MSKSKEELSRRRIEEARKALAYIIQKLENHIQNVEWACEQENWNSGVTYDMREASQKLGMCLATLTTWFDEPEEESEKEED